jgi:hypothetical protein
VGVGVPPPICLGSGVHPHPHPRFAGNRGSTVPTPTPDLPESGIQLSTIEYRKGVEFRLPQCLTLRLIVLPKLIKLRRPAMSDHESADQNGSMVSVDACIVAVRMELDLDPLSNHDNLIY